jgi:peptide methionine sulfoxide reductase msrA/msrB
MNSLKRATAGSPHINCILNINLRKAISSFCLVCHPKNILAGVGVTGGRPLIKNSIQYLFLRDIFMIKLKTLTPETQHIVRDKGTEARFSGEYDDETGAGTYLCRSCGLALYRGDAKFQSTCGWPSYDDEIPNTVRRQADHDGRRTEILCARCNAHLGHVFTGENYTAKNIRHCVNSTAVDFVKSTTILDSEEAVFAGGCFWGVQHLLQQLPGVVKTEVGYSGGHVLYPSYQDVCHKHSGHLEVTRVIFDPAILNYETLAKVFFEIHDPTQTDGQGPDIGPSYLSAVFYYNQSQKNIAETLIQQLRAKGFNVVTQLREACVFWTAEESHQAYYDKTGKAPYCHQRVKRFD